MLFHSIDQIFDSNSGVSLVGLVPNEGVLQQLVCVGPLVIVLHQNSLNEILELGTPAFGF